MPTDWKKWQKQGEVLAHGFWSDNIVRMLRGKHLKTADERLLLREIDEYFDSASRGRKIVRTLKNLSVKDLSNYNETIDIFILLCIQKAMKKTEPTLPAYLRFIKKMRSELKKTRRSRIIDQARTPTLLLYFRTMRQTTLNQSARLQNGL